MMNWEGSIAWSASTGAGRVRVGEHYVPSRVTLTAAGADGSPDMLFEFSMSQEGEARCVRAHVDAHQDGRGIATADLALIAIDQLTVSAFEHLAQSILYERDGRVGTAFGGPISGDKAIRRAVDKGRQTKSAELAAVARVYMEADRAPIKAVEDRLGYTRRTAARRIDLARERGLLPKKGEPLTDRHRAAVEQAASSNDRPQVGIDSFDSPAAFDAWWESQGGGGRNV